MYNESNFFKNTTCFFTVCDRPDRAPDYKSKSGSEYWYVNGGVIRSSSHWACRANTCDWFIDGVNLSAWNAGRIYCAFAKFESFMSKDDRKAQVRAQFAAEAAKKDHNRRAAIENKIRQAQGLELIPYMTY